MNDNETYEPLDYDEPRDHITSKKKKRGGKATETTIIKRELTEDDDGVERMTFAALFDPGPDDANAETVVRVRVFRADPREGYLGYIEDMNATEEFIQERWGGSVYKLEGLNVRGRITRVRTVVIGGDPIFIGEAFEAQWRKQKGLTPKAKANAQELSTKDMLELIQEREIALRKELADKEERERKERQEREEARRRDEREFQLQREREQREWDERRRREQEEADRRRVREEEEREARRRRDLEEAQQRQQQFMTQMLTVVQSQANNMISFVKETVAMQAAAGPKGGDPSEMLIKGVQLALQLKEAAGGEGEEDLLTTVVKNLPQMLNSAGNAVGKAIREVKGGGSAPALANPGGPKVGVTPQGGLMLPPGPVSEKFAAIVNRVVEAGGDPEQALANVADKLLTGGRGTPAPKQPAAVAAPQPSTSKPVVFDPGPPSTVTEPEAPTENPQSVNTALTVSPASADGIRRMKFTNGA